MVVLRAEVRIVCSKDDVVKAMDLLKQINAINPKVYPSRKSKDKVRIYATINL